MEKLVRPLGLETEPHPQRVLEPEHLAVPRHGGERHRVQIVDDDPLALIGRLGSGPVCAHRGRRHLDQFVTRRSGESPGRVLVLLDLRGERAAAGSGRLGPELRREEPRDRPREPVPLDDRVAVRHVRLEQLAVLDKDERLHDGRRDGVEALVDAGGVQRAVQDFPLAVGDREPGLRLLGVDGVQPEVETPAEAPGDARLGVDPVTVLVHGRADVGETRIPAPHVERPPGSLPGLALGLGADPVGDPRRPGREQPGLDPRRARLHVRDRGEREQRTDDPRPLSALPAWRFHGRVAFLAPHVRSLSSVPVSPGVASRSRSLAQPPTPAHPATRSLIPCGSKCIDHAGIAASPGRPPPRLEPAPAVRDVLLAPARAQSVTTSAGAFPLPVVAG